jgi:hypothetical protein
VPLQLFTEELDRVGATCDGLEGVHHAKAKREASSKTLRMNSGVSSLNIVDDGHGMRARHAGGELVLSLADLSETTESSLGAEGGKTPQQILRCHFILKARSIYQDRLGRNTHRESSTQKRGAFFRRECG